MTGKKLPHKQSRALFRALQSVVLTHFPNPERKDCPGTPVLRAIATKSISMRDPAIDHVGRCSPCFAELTEMRHALQRRKVLWATGTAAAAVVILALLVSYFSLPRVNKPVQQEAIQTGATDLPKDAAQTGGPTPPGGTLSTTPVPQPKYATALLDLRNVSAARTTEPPDPTSTQPIEIPRGLLALTIQLPIGSDAGSYEVEIRKSNQAPIRVAKGQARTEDGITQLITNIDTSSIQPGEYDFGWRLVDFSWRHHPILVR